MTSSVKDKLCLALDVNNADEALSLVNELHPYVGCFKVGLELFTSYGPSFVEKLVRDHKVFLDLKLHDIPNTVAKTSAVLAKMGVYMFNVHIGGGHLMLTSAMKAVKDAQEKDGIVAPKVIGVTVLTSLGTLEILEDLGLERHIKYTAKDLFQSRVRMSLAAGLDGIVCSPKEDELFFATTWGGQNFLKVTPGIRDAYAPRDDQNRTATPAEALGNGSDMLVIGRPILNAPDRAAAAQLILTNMEAHK
jgi:orotidine-5'-phosphate decarboxylase